MRRLILLLAILGPVLAVPSFCRGEVKVVWDRNENGQATADFRFKNVPPPSRADAATNARFSLAGGSEDLHGGDVDVLNDGLLPAGDDDPQANYFLAAGSRGGRLWVDLGEVRDVHQVNTYSWHRTTRGPQVYRLYASDGSAGGFQLRPDVGADPVGQGWTSVASVDTRPAEGEPGGQYGASVFDSRGSLGKYRYLLFDIAPTESADPFGNTFFSEIDVADGQQHTAVPLAEGSYEIRFDTSETPDLDDWVQRKLRPQCDAWYPKIVQMLASDGFKAPRRVRVAFKKDMQGVAFTVGSRVQCAAPWFRGNLDGEAAGAVIHELVHVVQQYGRGKGGRSNPGWMVEGIADYVRWFHYEPASLRPRPNAARAHYTDSYRTTAAFLNYVAETHGQDVIGKFNAAMREGRYSDSLWKKLTGKTADQLWAEYVTTLTGGARETAN